MFKAIRYMRARHWLIFAASFAIAFVVFTLGFELFYRAAGRKYDGLLGQYRREKERRGE